MPVIFFVEKIAIYEPWWIQSINGSTCVSMCNSILQIRMKEEIERNKRKASGGQFHTRTHHVLLGAGVRGENENRGHRRHNDPDWLYFHRGGANKSSDGNSAIGYQQKRSPREQKRDAFKAPLIRHIEKWLHRDERDGEKPDEAALKSDL